MIPTPPEKRMTWLRKFAHRNGLARGLQRGNWCSERGFLGEYVETALPWKWLARYAAAHHGLRVTEVEHYGRLRRRWRLKPIGPRPICDRSRGGRR